MTTRDADSDVTTNPARLLARSLYRELASHGYDPRQILAVATELIGEVTVYVRRSGDVPASE